MAVPDFVCIGAQKAGTTWLYQTLRQHPTLFFPPIKEIHFFDYLYIAEHRPWINAAYTRHLARLAKQPLFADYARSITALDRTTDAWYQAVFEHESASGCRRGEITPAYAILPHAGVRHVLDLNPAVRILFIVRDPVERAVSHLRMHASRRGLERIKASILANESLMAAVTSRSDYAACLERWHRSFASDQVLVLSYAAMRRSPSQALRKIEGFLDLHPHDYQQLGASVHASSAVAIDDAVVDALRHRLRPQYDFIQRNYGDGFLQ